MGNSCVLKVGFSMTNTVILKKNVGGKLGILNIFDEMHKGHPVL